MSGWTPERFNEINVGRLPGMFGLEVLRVEHGELDARMELREEFMAPNGFLHAGAVVSIADSCCGEGCLFSLPEGMSGFTTSELKSNFLRSTGPDDVLLCEARLAHGGRTTQVWDATVRREGRQAARPVPLHAVPPRGRRSAYAAALASCRLGGAARTAAMRVRAHALGLNRV